MADFWGGNSVAFYMLLSVLNIKCKCLFVSQNIINAIMKLLYNIEKIKKHCAHKMYRWHMLQRKLASILSLTKGAYFQHLC